MTATQGRNYRRYKDGDTSPADAHEQAVRMGESYKCPTYVHRTPPCQSSCPSGHDIRGWLSIVRGLDKPVDPGQPWQQSAFERMAIANPFPAVMGRVCPAPCQDGCNRNEVEEHVGINAVEQYIGDWALAKELTFAKPERESGKKVAIVGGGPAGLAAAYFLRKRGHGCTIFESYKELGGMMRFGIPGYRTPKDVLAGEIKRIVEMGVEVRLGTRVGTDVTVEALERDFDAVFWAIGAQSGNPLAIPGFDAPNCVSGIAFLRAFNEGRLRHLSGRVLVVGAGDTAMDVVAVARRIGHIGQVSEKDRPENVILGHTVHDVATAAAREGAEVWIVYRRPIGKAPATQHELKSVIAEGVQIHDSLAPVEVIKDARGWARALKVVPVKWDGQKMTVLEGQEYEIECELIVAATGQAGDFTGIEAFDNGRGLMDADKFYQSNARPGHFVGGDVIRPHLLTTAIGQASIAVDEMERYMAGEALAPRPKVDAHHFSLLDELRAHGLAPSEYRRGEARGTDSSAFAVHNYEDRSFAEIARHDRLFLGHFTHAPMHRRPEAKITAHDVLGNFEERFKGFSEEQAIKEAGRCMSCGMCFECDNCVIYCPQLAIQRVKKSDRTMGRYVETDYSKCTGCHICMDVCPAGYIEMGLGK
jgi:NADPH-dependent glutamate synthase beta subunit-like oxidoreductase